MKRTFEEIYETQAKLLYGLIVAGKSATFADRVLKDFLARAKALIRKEGHGNSNKLPPFGILANLSDWNLNAILFESKSGNYGKLFRAFREIANQQFTLDLFTCKPSDLEKIHGVGPKTSRFVIMWIRPEEIHAALDVHVLRWMREKMNLADAPHSTPSDPAKYSYWENMFVSIAADMGKTPRELDIEIWEAGAKRTQRTPLPKG